MRIGRQMRLILEYLAKIGLEKCQRESKIIRLIYNMPFSRWDEGHDISPSRRASISRSLKILKDHGLVALEFHRYRYNFKRRYGEHKLWGRRVYNTGMYKYDIEEGTLKLLDEEKYKEWTSKPWYGITEKGIELVNKLNANNSGNITPDINVKEASS